MVAVSVNPRAKTWIQEVAFDMSDRYLMQKVYDSFPFHLTRRTAHRPVPHVLKVQWNMWPPEDVESWEESCLLIFSESHTLFANQGPFLGYVFIASWLFRRLKGFGERSEHSVPRLLNFAVSWEFVILADWNTCIFSKIAPLFLAWLLSLSLILVPTLLDTSGPDSELSPDGSIAHGRSRPSRTFTQYYTLRNWWLSDDYLCVHESKSLPKPEIQIKFISNQFPSRLTLSCYLIKAMQVTQFWASQHKARSLT
jgi:hypothetical protein